MKTVVISLGGSLIVPDSIDVGFLKGFKALIEDYSSKVFRFVLVCGGGKVCRDYQKALSDIIGHKPDAEDWLGISATHLNAQLVKSLFEDVHSEIICNLSVKLDFDEKVLVAGGWKPGFSTDNMAVLLAKNLGVKKVVNMTNVDYVYDKNPNSHKDAKKFEELSWSEFEALNDSVWSPGMHKPFDPVASRDAEAAGLTVMIIGSNLDNLRNLLDGKAFAGTTIH